MGQECDGNHPASVKRPEPPYLWIMCYICRSEGSEKILTDLSRFPFGVDHRTNNYHHGTEGDRGPKARVAAAA